jgi:pilus assembly protein TadC
MTTTVDTLGGTAAARKDSRLSDQVRAVRTRAAGFGFDRIMLVAGGILMPLGIVLILFGWAGAARTPLPFEQTDYLISGGILGLGLTFVGGFLYFGYWQTVRINESRAQTRQLANSLARVEALLAGGASVDDAGKAVPAAKRYVATPSGSIFHLPDCATVAGRADLREVDPSRTNLKPCRICNPLDS